MIITCPSCAARYDVPDDAISAKGRRIQCGDCGHAWVQRRPAETVVAAAVGGAAEPTPSEATYPEVQEPPRPDPIPDPAPEPALAENFAAEPPPAPSVAPPEPTIAARPRPVLPPEPDPEDPFQPEGEAEKVRAEIARARERYSLEAALAQSAQETGGAASRTATPPVEPATDLGVRPEATATPFTAAAAVGPSASRLDGLGGANPPPPGDETRLAPGRPPDLTQSGYDPDEEAMARMRRDLAAEAFRDPGPSRFLLGFLFALLVVVCALALYFNSEVLTAMIPSLEPYLTQYVAWVDGLREMVGGWGSDLIAYLEKLAETPPPPTS